MTHPFHLAIPVTNLADATNFYESVLGCSRGREDEHWIDNAFADTSRAQPLQSEGAAFGLSLANDGSVIVELKSPYSDGTTHIVLSPMEFIGRLVALVPKPRVNLTRFHGVFSPNSQLRKKIVPKQAIQVEAEHLAKCQIGSKQ
ncbi:MAG: catechol 2,3-dioxygenase-like lactoylglutathione lyase family enzyme [Candidatus Azotimanducaceae bacterium]|jgi:catechol 2,3-dioxygenase-like lactoylglutathione lyase family enzyme